MSDYTRIYNLTVKDSLPTGNSGKVIKGTELDAELNAVASAVASKADTNSPTFTGTPVAPTAVSGTSTTQIATTAFVSNAPTITSPALLGTPTAPTAAAATNTTQIATTAHVYAERSNAATLTNKTINLTSNTLTATSAQIAAAVTDETGSGALVFGTSPTISSPALTGTPTAPTAAVGTNTTQLATTQYVFAERTNSATLTNKTLNLSDNTLVATSAQVAAAVTDETGSGSLVFGTSPTIATPTISSPNLTGTPVAPTAAYGTNTTQLATTAFVQAALQAMYPVGSVYINASVTTNPSSLLGFGTWVSVGDGKVLVNQDTTDTSFDTMGETGGSKNAIVVDHNHTATSTSSSTSTVTDPGHTHTYGTARYKTLSTGGDPNNAWAGGGSDSSDVIVNSGSNTTGITVATSTTTTTSIANSGSSGTNANLQPYVVVRMWKRTA